MAVMSGVFPCVGRKFSRFFSLITFLRLTSASPNGTTEQISCKLSYFFFYSNRATSPQQGITWSCKVMPQAMDAVIQQTLDTL